MSEHETDIFDQLGQKWPSTIVARREVKTFSGGLISPKTMANLDSLGQGPEGLFRCGTVAAYPVAALITWLRDRSR